MTDAHSRPRLKGHRFPHEIIAQAVRLYLRFNLSLRDVEELLAERGVVVSYETIRKWVARFAPQFAAAVRRARPAPNDQWHLHEMVIRIHGETHWLWRAVDAGGEVLDMLVQSRRNAKAAERFLRKLIQRWGRPRVIVTDKLGSYASAIGDLAPGLEHRRHKGINNRVEASHRHTRRREKALGRFKSPGQAQQLLSAHDQFAVPFRPKRHRLSARSNCNEFLQTWGCSQCF
ncbi:IS6 family transposase [Rubrimonas cliftonensis]|uniref:Putative transposase n=1 Tax=Rubrimonas cliftonensis TaxID=89524 RepID=A0A1H4G834_9RHOB|nr:IS6 family transposase [Rubrimonas cliftonensis]SEB04842.1 putative transposase [Rubrimonas cliftonensis]